MGLITIIKDAAAIIEGNARYLLEIRTSIMEHREEEYCKKCPLALNEGRYTGICDAKRGGCGCSVGPKTSQNEKPCPLGFWANDWFKPDKFEEFLNEQNGV